MDADSTGVESVDTTKEVFAADPVGVACEGRVELGTGEATVDAAAVVGDILLSLS